MTPQLAHPCIEWEGSVNSYGYGVTRLAKGHNQVGAHRVSYCIEHGLDLADIKDYIIRHRCDNRICVQPSHLQIGDVQDNANDMVERGRSLTGTKNHSAVLTEKDVLDIRKVYKKGCRKYGQLPLSKKYGVSQMTVWSIVNRMTWRHI